MTCCGIHLIAISHFILYEFERTHTWQQCSVTILEDILTIKYASSTITSQVTAPFPKPLSHSSPIKFRSITVDRTITFPSPTKKSSLNISYITTPSPTQQLPTQTDTMTDTMNMNITEFLEHDTLELSILDVQELPSELLEPSPKPNNTQITIPICTTPKKPMTRTPRKRKMSQNLKHLIDSCKRPKADPISRNHCFICRGKYSNRGQKKNPWIGCDCESVCHSWAHMKCIGWGHLVGEDVSDRPYLCPKCS